MIIFVEKALELHKEIGGTENFVASEGWLSGWKKKYGIRQLTISGEKVSADFQAAEKFKDSDAPRIINGNNLLPCQIFNADETGIYFKKLPQKTLADKQDRSAAGCKQNKERITAMPCSNADGSLKLPLLVIGKSAQPRAIKNIPKKNLPVIYKNQKNAWMNTTIFKAWFEENFVPAVKKFLKERKLPMKAVLFLDNCSAHPGPNVLSANGIQVYFLPANTTSILQPMDQGIIQNIKLKYSSLLLKSILQGQESDCSVIESMKAITIRNAIYWLSEAWDHVSVHTISKCWKPLLSKTQFPNLSISTLETAEDNVANTEENEDILGICHRINGFENLEENDVQQWLEKNDDLTPMPSNAEIYQTILDDKENDSDG